MPSERLHLVRKATEKPEPIDYTKLYVEFAMKYRNVFMVKIEGQIYIYRSIGRAEYRKILEDNRFSDPQKEELICSQCMLYPNPDEYGWDDKEAGIPTELMKCILTDSYLDSPTRRSYLHDYYRSEMYDLDNQISCIISSAFPGIDIEEIESWDVDKTTKYLSRAEWILKNLHGMQFPEGGNNVQQQPQPQPQQEQQPRKESKRDKTLRGGSREDKLTPEKLRERAEFFRKHPEFAQGDIDDVAHMDQQETVDDLAPALRVPGQRKKLPSDYKRYHKPTEQK
jgi:hypothetical protein